MTIDPLGPTYSPFVPAKAGIQSRRHESRSSGSGFPLAREWAGEVSVAVCANPALLWPGLLPQVGFIRLAIAPCHDDWSTWSTCAEINLLSGKDGTGSSRRAL